MPRFILMLAAIAMLLVTGCGDEAGRGVVLTGDGKFGANNARNQRESTQDVLRIAIEEDLGKGWAVKVTVDEMPEWVEERNSSPGMWGTDGNWRWEKITAVVDIAPPIGQQLSSAKQADLEAGSRKHLLSKLRKRDPALVSYSLKIVDQIVAVQAPVVQPTGQTTYVVQPGDTVADISMAFYGSSQHWRVIAEANPAGTQPGQTIVIPAKPVAPAAVAPAAVAPTPPAP